MGVFFKLKKVASHIIDFRVDRWLDLKWNYDAATYFITLARKLIRRKTLTNPEEFEDSVKRQALTQSMLSRQAKHYKQLSHLFLVIALILVLYTVYILSLANVMGAGICVALIVYALSQAFRFHFWYFQINQRKLGCTVLEWSGSFVAKTNRDKVQHG